ncbi:MAG TPA: thermonuclease family protein [Coriobacteriia bacterium]|nr:thermonuclease family protein [Coriobacteriia bacterium]
MRHGRVWAAAAAFTLLLALSGCVVYSTDGSGATPSSPTGYNSGAKGAGSAITQVLSSKGADAVATAQKSAEVRQLAAVPANVTRVVDGDTIHVKLMSGKTEKVRLIGVDAPEYTTKHEPFGKQAKSFTREQLLHRHVYLETDVAQRDAKGRLLAYVWVIMPNDVGPDLSVGVTQIAERMFNAQLLAAGFAETLVVDPNVKYAPDFDALQNKAMAAKRGVWSATDAAEGTSGGNGSSASGRTAATGTSIGVVIGNCNSLKFHRPDCEWARKIDKTHKLMFDNREQALANHYRPCKTCRP